MPFVCILVLVTRHANRICYAPYCQLWSARLCHIFVRYLINGRIFGEKSYLI